MVQVLAIGASGHFAGLVVPALVARGARVRTGAPGFTNPDKLTGQEAP